MIQRAKDTAIKIKKEVRKNTTKAILAAFAFIIALVWRDAIRSGIDAVIATTGMEQTGYLYNLKA